MQFFQIPDNLIEFFRYHPRYLGNNLESIKTRDLKPPHQKFISVVTTCMNRKEDLARTLPRNLEDNRGYRNAEFIVLDYNSRDGVCQWLASNMQEHMESGRLKVYRCTDSEYFQPNHSRNVSFKLAKGEIVANVDADNIMHASYLKRINQCATIAKEKILIVAEDFLRKDSSRLKLRGRFALYKKDIEMLRGFDEKLDDGFSHDDINFVFRAMMAGFKLVRYEKEYNWDRAGTPDDDRVRYVRNPNYKEMQMVNRELTRLTLQRGHLSANKESWGEMKNVTMLLPNGENRNSI